MKKRVDYAKQVDVYTEYSIYAATLQLTDLRKRIELIEALNTRNPKNAHAAQMTQLQFATLRQLGDNAKALALAEKTLETDQTSEDMLAYVANDYVEKKRDPDKVVAYSAKIVELMDTKPKPEGVGDADWAKKEAIAFGSRALLQREHVIQSEEISGRRQGTARGDPAGRRQRSAQSGRLLCRAARQ